MWLAISIIDSVVLSSWAGATFLFCILALKTLAGFERKNIDFADIYDLALMNMKQEPNCEGIFTYLLQIHQIYELIFIEFRPLT